MTLSCSLQISSRRLILCAAGITAGTAVALNPLQEVGVLPSSSEDTGTGTNMDAQEPEPVVEGSI